MKAVFTRVSMLIAVVSCVCCVELQAANLRINQSKIRLSIQPGSAESGTIEITNTSDEVVTVKVYLEDWVYTDLNDGTKSFFPAGTTQFSACPWISFFPEQVTIGPFGREQVNFKVQVPEDAEGGHYAVLFFESVFGDSASGEGVGMSVVVRIGSLFYIETEEKIVYGAQLSNIALKKKNNDLVLTADFKNSGNVDITCAGTFHIMGEDGLVVSRGEFNQIFTFPGDSTQLLSSSRTNLREGTYFLILTLDLGKAKEDTGLGGGPVVTKEMRIKVNPRGEVQSLEEMDM